MTGIRTFRLPDLGEGLPDATIVEWLVKPGVSVELDAPLISMETAKAIVEVPSPYAGKLIKVYGENGDIIVTGAPLADFELDINVAQRSEVHDTGHHAAATPVAAAQSGASVHTGVAPYSAAVTTATPRNGSVALGADGATKVSGQTNQVASATRVDSGTVVGAMQSSEHVWSESPVALGGVKAMPAVRALAKKLNVDLSRITPSGENQIVTLRDVRAAAADPSLLSNFRMVVAAVGETSRVIPASSTDTIGKTTPRVAAGEKISPASGAALVFGTAMQLKGVRRNMARVMAQAQALVVLTTIFDDADIHAWSRGDDVSVRLLRSIVAASRAVPALNAWFDGDALTRTLHAQVDIGIAVDTADGLFVPALRDAQALDAPGLRSALDVLLKQVRDRSIAPSELAGYTISLSNFGVFAGRYATPIVVPPCVAIVAAGKLRREVVPVLGGVETHRLMPISLSFDHRAVTGGEAARFLQALLSDLTLAQ